MEQLTLRGKEGPVLEARVETTKRELTPSKSDYPIALTIKIPENYNGYKSLTNSRKQCSPGDLLVSSAWRTY